MNLSANFTLAELARGYASHDLDAVTMNNLRRTAIGLERARAILGVPLIVTSGLRAEDRNEAANGSDTSSHLAGLAGDFQPLGISPDAAFDKLIAQRGNLGDFDQVIVYPGSHLHLGFGPKMRRAFYRHQTGVGAVRVVLAPMAPSAAPQDNTRVTPRVPSATIPSPTGTRNGDIIAAIITLIGAVITYLFTRN